MITPVNSLGVVVFVGGLKVLNTFPFINRNLATGVIKLITDA